jgi:hypothetical protein
MKGFAPIVIAKRTGLSGGNPARRPLYRKGEAMRLREWDCGVYDSQGGFGRITVRERPDGRFDLIRVHYKRTAHGFAKSEHVIGVYSDLAQAKDAGWELSRSLRA